MENTFADLAAEAMAAKGLKPADLVRATGIPKNTISYYLAGKTHPRAERLEILCQALGLAEPEYPEEWGCQSRTSGTRLRTIWKGMKQRCYYPNHSSYKNYGARGVTVCEAWFHSFAAFRYWAITHGYRAHLTLDRIDPAGDYSPDNCRWATYSEQAQNKRTC